jgi:hypothetical protein
MISLKAFHFPSALKFHYTAGNAASKPVPHLSHDELPPPHSEGNNSMASMDSPHHSCHCAY